MNVARKHVIWLLMMALPLSSLAIAAAPCVQDGEPSPAQETIVDAHAQHGSGHHGAHDQTRDAQDDESALVECPCCDHCLTMCVMSGCSSAAIASESREFLPDAVSSSISLTDIFRVGPTPHPLFRPPIPIA